MLRAAVLLGLLLPLLMLPLVLRWRYGSWDPCEWLGAQQREAVEAGEAPRLEAGTLDGLSAGQCARLWLEGALR